MPSHQRSQSSCPILRVHVLKSIDGGRYPISPFALRPTLSLTFKRNSNIIDGSRTYGQITSPKGQLCRFNSQLKKKVAEGRERKGPVNNNPKKLHFYRHLGLLAAGFYGVKIFSRHLKRLGKNERKIGYFRSTNSSLLYRLVGRLPCYFSILTATPPLYKTIFCERTTSEWCCLLLLFINKK